MLPLTKKNRNILNLSIKLKKSKIILFSNSIEKAFQTYRKCKKNFKTKII